MSTTDFDWANLPEDLLIRILDLLRSIPDLLRSAAVCTSWSSAVREMRRRRLPLLPDAPWLMIRETPLHAGAVKYYRLSEHKFYTVPLPDFHPDSHHVLGCSHGWLIIARQEFNDLCLLNPITGARIEDLPPADSISYAEAMYGDVGDLIRFRQEDTSTLGSEPYTQHVFNLGFHKAILSANPSINGDYTIALLNEEPTLLTFARAGDREWTTIFSGTPYDDIAFHGNKLYMITCEGFMQVLNLDEDEFSLDFLPAPVRDPGSRIFDYLVPCPSTGDLFQVRVALDSVPDTIVFSVYRIDSSKEQILIQKEKNLKDLDFFVGRKNSICRPCSESPPELRRPHCIYVYQDEALLICDWKDGSVEFVTTAPDHHQGVRLLQNTWITPSLI